MCDRLPNLFKTRDATSATTRWARPEASNTGVPFIVQARTDAEPIIQQYAAMTINSNLNMALRLTAGARGRRFWGW
jgi:hypothetical protein